MTNSTYYDRYNVRSNIDIKLTNTTKVSVNLAGQYSSKRAPSPGSDAIFANILEAPPYYFPARFSDGRFAAHPVEQKMNNPYNYALASGYHKYWTVRLQSDIALEQDLSSITPGLKIRGQASFDNYSDWKLDRPYTVEQFVVNPANTTGGHLPDGSLDLVQFKPEVKFGTPETTTSNLSKRIYLEARLNYDRTFNDVHSVSGMLTYFQKEQQDAGSGALPYRKQNLTGRAVYSYDRRYTAEVNFGYTGSENFVEGHRFGLFPAFSASWNIANEAFLKNNTDIFNELRLRASYGLTGNDDIGASSRFPYRSSWNSSGSGYSTGIGATGSVGSLGGITENYIASPLLTWEKETKRNFGLDVTLFNHQLKANVDVFFNNRTDILMQRKTVSQVAGLRQSPWQNFGKMNNQGYELDLSYTRDIGDFNIDLNVNYSFAKNKITEYDEIPNKYEYYNSTGKSWNRNVLYVAERLYEDADFDISTGSDGKKVYALKPGVPVPSTFSPLPGDIKMSDINNDGVIDTYDRTYAWGYSRDPQVMYGFGGSFEYKKSWYLSIFFQGRDQMTVVLTNGSIRPFQAGVNRSQARAEILDRWTEDNPRQDVMFPRMTTTQRPSLNYDPSTWWARSGRYLKLKTLEFGYKFPKKSIEKLRLEAARIFFIGQNLFSWDDIKMWDPDMGDSGGMRYPIPRTFTAGLELTF